MGLIPPVIISTMLINPSSMKPKLSKFLYDHLDKPKSHQNRWKRFRSSGRILPRFKLLLKSKILKNFSESSAKMKKRTSRCSSLSIYRATKFKNYNMKWASSETNLSQRMKHIKKLIKKSTFIKWKKSYKIYKTVSGKLKKNTRTNRESRRYSQH